MKRKLVQLTVDAICKLWRFMPLYAKAWAFMNDGIEDDKSDIWWTHKRTSTQSQQALSRSHSELLSRIGSTRKT